MRSHPVAVEAGERVLAKKVMVCPVCGQNPTAELFQATDRFHGRDFQFELRRCPACTLVWVSNPPSPAEMSFHYGAAYHRAITNASETSPERWQSHKDVVSRHKKGGAVLDLGCSSGSFLASIQAPGWELHGIEMSANEAENARKRTGADVFVGDIADAAFPANSFDVITCFDVLEHVYNPRECLKKVEEWLKPGGIFYVFLPNIDAWESHFFKSYWFGLELPRHLYHFSPESLRTVAKLAGLTEVSLSTPVLSYADHSLRYVYDDALLRLGYRRDPMSVAITSPLPWKIVRKLLRLIVLSPWSYVQSVSGKGPAIAGVFAKSETPVNGGLR